MPAGPSTPYPGQRLGLPADGPGSVAGWGRRALALLVDWFACKLVLTVFLGAAAWTGSGLSQLAPLGLFLLEASLLTTLAGGSFGQLVTRVAVIHLDGKPVTFLRAVLRTFLICLVIPPLVFNADQRGLQDLAAKTVTVRR
jgi:uncharacterized RDD family membrane protein YckC